MAWSAYRQIKDRILTAQLAPGSMVYALDLAKTCGMSGTPVHQALKMLCADRLLQVIPRVGYVVSPITVADVDEIFQLRLTNEVLAVDLAMTRASQTQLDEFARTAFRPSLPTGADSPPLDVTDPRFVLAAARVHREFHVRVAALSGNHRLVDLISRLLEESDRFVIPDTARRAADMDWTKPPNEHPGIVEAIVRRDREGAIAAMTEHTRGARRQVMETLMPEPLAYVHPDEPIGSATTTHVR